MATFKRILNSGFLLTVIYLVGIDSMLTGILPALFPVFYDTNFPNPDQKCGKVVRYLTSDKNPSVLLLGSSLIRTAAAASDTGVVDAPTSELANDYEKADYFREALNNKLSTNFELLNLAMRGCMASDYGMIVRKTVELGKHPQIVIVGTAPAEFMSNDQPVVSNTYVYQCLQKYRFPQGQSPLTVAYDAAQRAWEPHSLKAIETQLTYAKRWLTSKMSDATGHPMDMFNAEQKMLNGTPVATAISSNRPNAEECESPASHQGNKLADLEHYRMRYHPPNVKLFDEHMRNFEALLKLSHDKGVPLVVINMPITDQNKALIDPTLLKRYYQSISDLTSKYQISFINADVPSGYTLADFNDSSHLNVQGGKKFFVNLSEQLSKQSNVSAIAQTAGSKPL